MRHKSLCFPMIILAALLILAINLGASEIRLCIVYSDSLKSTIRTIKGIERSIGKQFPTATFDNCLMTSNRADINSKIDLIIKENPRLILTVGSFATKEICEKIKNKPVIFSAVLNPETSGFVKSLNNPGGNITGASLDIPPNIQFKYYKQVIAGLKKIGVLYTDETANLIPPARVLAHNAGLDLIAIKINSEKDIPSALDTLNNSVDGIWSVADRKIFSPRSTKYILLNCLRNGKPFMGFSRNLVESGALFALDFDYKDIGRQAGRIAIEVLSGKPAGSISVAVPGIVWFHYNEKTAKHINVTLPDDLIAIAKEVYH
jgi:putative ABC transport system substrate-binding protein